MTAELKCVVESRKDVLDDAEVDLETALKAKPFKDDAVRCGWAYYKRMLKAYNDSVTKLQEAYLKQSKYDEYKALDKDMATSVCDMVKLEGKVSKVLHELKPQPAAVTTPTGPDSSSNKMVLPRRELPQFTGEVREWLAFQASFKEINDDKSLSNSDKFHLLIQSTTDGSPARKLLQSYPFTTANFQPAYKALEDRFGRNTVFVKVYVRDLLTLVIDASTGQTMEFGDLVTTITSQIRNLESLGVTKDKCAMVLYPVVESCLPTEVLQAWQRCGNFQEDLDELLKFLQQKVNSHAERTLAHFSLNNSRQDKGNRNSNSNKNKRNGGDVPTASSFVTGASSSSSQGGNRNNERPQCVLCNKSHSTIECRSALGMSLSEKRDILKNRSYCFVCLRKGTHYSRDCKSSPKCSICNKKHFAVMCPNLDRAKENPSSTAPASAPAPVTPPVPADQMEKVAQLSNNVGSPEVPMQTLVVTLHGANGKTKTARLMIDTGSARSYIRSDLAHELNFKGAGEESVFHELFGARDTEEIHYKKVKVLVSDTNAHLTVLLLTI